MTSTSNSTPTFGQRVGGAIDYMISYVYSGANTVSEKAAQTTNKVTNTYVSTKSKIEAIPSKVSEATKNTIHAGAMKIARSTRETHTISTDMEDFSTYLKSQKKPSLVRLAHAIADFFIIFFDKHFSKDGKMARDVLKHASNDVQSFYDIHYKAFNKLNKADPLVEIVSLAHILGAKSERVQNRLSALIDDLTNQVAEKIESKEEKPKVTSDDDVFFIKEIEIPYIETSISTEPLEIEEKAPEISKKHRKPRRTADQIISEQPYYEARTRSKKV